MLFPLSGVNVRMVGGESASASKFSSPPRYGSEKRGVRVLVFMDMEMLTDG